MVFSIIQKSQLEGAKRIDAEYYQPEFLLLKEQLLKYGNLLPLSKVSTIKTGHAYNGEEIDEKFEIPVARIGDVTNKKDIGDWYKLSTKEFDKFKNNAIGDGDILMTMTGDPPDVGKVNLINNKDKRVLAFNQRVAKIRANQIDNKYLFAYLNTEFSRFQAERASLGIRQRNLGTDDLRNILVAVSSKNQSDEINKIVDTYFYNLEKSKSLYQQAEKLLLDELNIKEEDFDDKLTFVINLSDVKNAKRMDADFFQPKDRALLSKLGKTERLSSLAKRKKGVFKLVKDKMYKYTEIGDINVGSGEISFNEVAGSELPANAKNKVIGSELIVSKVRPTRGAIAVIPKNWDENHVVSGAFSVFDVESPTREYLQIVLRSMIGKVQMERPATGTSYPTITDVDVENILVPILPKLIQEKIAKLVRESFESRKKAKELLEEAKRKVEEMIEGGNN